MFVLSAGANPEPAEVAAVDLIRIMERYADIAPAGMVIAEVCTTPIGERVPGKTVFANVLYYGIHAIREMIYTEKQRRLLNLLAGLQIDELKNFPDSPGDDGPALLSLS